MRTRIPLIVTLALGLLGLHYGLLQAANVNWLNGGGGTWTDTANWTSSPSLPGPGDAVIIDNISPNNIAINLTGPVPQIGSLKLAENLNISGAGALGVLGTTELLNGAQINVAGAGLQFSGAGVATLHGANLSATQGAKIVLDQDNIITHTDPAFLRAAQISSDGPGSLIDLSGTKTVAGSGQRQATYTFQAINGGTLDLSSLASVTGGAVNFEANGPGSTLSIPLLTSSNQTNFAAKSGAQLTAPLTSYSNVTDDANKAFSFMADGAKSALSLPALTEMTGSNARSSEIQFMGTGGGAVQAPVLQNLTTGLFRFTAGHGKVLLPQLANINGGRTVFEATGTDSQLDIGALKTANSASWTAREGAQISAPLVTNYSHAATDPNVPVMLQAHGNNGLLNLSGITQMAGNKMRGSDVMVQGLKRGKVDLSHVANLTTGQFQFLADDGTIDLTALQTTADGKALFEAHGTDGEIKLPALQSAFETSFVARDGAHLAAPALTQLLRDTTNTNSPVQLVADKQGSLLQIPALTQITSSNQRGSDLMTQASAGGEVQFDQLAALGAGRFQFLADHGQIDLPNLTSVAAGTVDGATLFDAKGAPAGIDFPKLASVRGTSFMAEAGANLTMPSLTSFVHDTAASNNLASLVADGSKSRLHFGALTTLASNSTRGSNVSINAKVGGHIDFDALSTFGGGTIDVVASGAGSTINLNALTTIPAGQTRFESRGASSHVGLEQLASAADTGFETFEGGQISLPKLATYTHATATTNQPAFWTADGVGSRVSAPALTQLSSNMTRSSSIQLHAANGGLIDLSTATSITDGLYSILAEGAGSKVDFSKLVSTTSPGTTAQDISPITVQNDALLAFNPATTTLQDAAIVMTGGGKIAGGTLNLTGRSSLTADGLIAATVSIEGPTRIAGDAIGLLDISGGFTQKGDKGEMVVQIGGDTPGSSHDAIHVAGDANISGKLTIQLARDYQPLLGQSFEVLTSNHLTGGFDKGGILAGNVFLAPSVSGQNIVVLAALPGDVNLDGSVNLADFGILKAGFGQPGGGLGNGDVNASGGTDLADFGLLKENFGKTGGPKAGALAPVPEPSAAALALMGLLAFAAGRRRFANRNRPLVEHNMGDTMPA